MAVDSTTAKRNAYQNRSSKANSSRGISIQRTEDENSDSSASPCKGQRPILGGILQVGGPVKTTTYESASTGGKLLFTWLNPVINVCMSRTVRAEELPPLGPSDDVAHWAEAIDRSLAKEEARATAAAIRAARKEAAAAAKKRQRAARREGRKSALVGATAKRGETVGMGGRDGDESVCTTDEKAPSSDATRKRIQRRAEKVDAEPSVEERAAIAAAAARKCRPSLLRALWVTFRRTLLWTLIVYILRDALGVLNTYFLKQLLEPTGGDLARWRRTLMVGLGISLVQLTQIFVDTAVDFYACRIYMRVEICLLTSLFKRLLHPDPFVPPAAVIKGAPVYPAVDIAAPDTPVGQHPHVGSRPEKSRRDQQQQRQGSHRGMLQQTAKDGGEQPKQLRGLHDGEKQRYPTPQEKSVQGGPARMTETHDICNDSVDERGQQEQQLKGKGDLKGNVFNLMFVDIPSVASVIFTFLDISLLPVRLSFAALMLYSQVGLEAELPGLAVALGTTALTVLLEIGNARLKAAYMRYRDVRLDKSHEMLTYMKTVRLMGWEDIAEARIRHWRQLEMEQRSKRMYISAVSSWLSTSAAMAMSVATFVSYSLPFLHRESFRLRPELAIPVIHLLDNFIGPITDFPYAVSNTIEGLISLKRLQQCFFSPLLQHWPPQILYSHIRMQQQASPGTALNGGSRSSRDVSFKGSRTRSPSEQHAPADTETSSTDRQALTVKVADQQDDGEKQPLLTKKREEGAPLEKASQASDQAEDQREKSGEIKAGGNGDQEEAQADEAVGFATPPDTAQEAQILLNVLTAFPATEVYLSHASFTWQPHTLSPFSSLASMTARSQMIHYCAEEEREEPGECQRGKRKLETNTSSYLAYAAGSRPTTSAGGSPTRGPPRSRATSALGGDALLPYGSPHWQDSALLRPPLLAVLPADELPSAGKASSVAEGSQEGASYWGTASSSVAADLETKTATDVTAAIDGVSLHVSRGELLLVTGVPGSGKSSLLHAILQHRELLLLRGCCFVRSAFCIHFPRNYKGIPAAEGVNNNEPKVIPHVQKGLRGVQSRQEQRHQHDTNRYHITSNALQYQNEGAPSGRGEERATFSAARSLICSPRLKSTSEDAERQDAEELEALLLHSEIGAAAPIGYVSQEPWLQVGTVRENIMFGCEADEKLYEQIIQAFDLRPDFSTWPGGDSRFIDEGGADLSAGQRMRITMARAAYVCLAYRRRAAKHAAAVRQQIKYRERELKHQLRAVATAGVGQNGIAEKALHKSIHVDGRQPPHNEQEENKRMLQRSDQGEGKLGEQKKEKESGAEEAAMQTVAEAAEHVDSHERQAPVASEREQGDEEAPKREKSHTDAISEQQQPSEKKEGRKETQVSVRDSDVEPPVSAGGESSGRFQVQHVPVEIDWEIARSRTGTPPAAANGRWQERLPAAGRTQAPQSVVEAAEDDVKEDVRKQDIDMGANEDLTLPYLFCFDEAFSPLDPGVAERVFRNLFGRKGLLRDAAVVLASSEQSLLNLVSNIYLEDVREDLEKTQQRNRTHQVPQESQKKAEPQQDESREEDEKQVKVQDGTKQEHEQQRGREAEDASVESTHRALEPGRMQGEGQQGGDRVAGATATESTSSRFPPVAAAKEGEAVAKATPALRNSHEPVAGSPIPPAPHPVPAEDATAVEDISAAASCASPPAAPMKEDSVTSSAAGDPLVEKAKRTRDEQNGARCVHPAAPDENDAAAGKNGELGKRMKMSICYIDKGRVVWKGSVEEFQIHTATRLKQQVSSVTATVTDGKTPASASGAEMAMAVEQPGDGKRATDQVDTEESTLPLFLSSAQTATTAQQDFDEAAVEAATPRSTIESVLRFLPIHSTEDVDARVAGDKDREKDEAARKTTTGKEEADELLKEMMVQEQAASGQVGWPSYRWYLRATGIFLSWLFVCLLLLTAFTDFASDVWIAKWTGLSPSARRTRAAKNVGTRKEPPNVEGPVGLLGEERKMREAETQAAGALAEHGQDIQTEKKQSSPTPAEKDARATHALYLWFYVGLAAANIFLELLIKIVETRGSLLAAERIHDKLLHVLCNAPLWFYDQNPIGRIINRLSTDVAVLDCGIFKRMGLALTAFFSCVFALLVLGITTVWTLPLLPFLLLGVYILVFRYYRSTCRELQRASLISFSPLCSSFSESLSGREVIFALRREKLFALRNVEQVELAQRAKLMHWALSAWASIRLQLLSFPLALVSAVGPRLAAAFSSSNVQQLVFHAGGAGGGGAQGGGEEGGGFFAVMKHNQRSGQSRLGYLGLAVSYSLSIASALRRMMHHFTHLEKEMCSLERIHEYAAEAEPLTLRRLADIARQPSARVAPVAGAAAVDQQQRGFVVLREPPTRHEGDQEERAAELLESRRSLEVGKEKEEGTGALPVAPFLSAADTATVSAAARAVPAEKEPTAGEAVPGEAAAEEEEAGEEDEDVYPTATARRGVVLEGVEVCYRRAGYQYIPQVREALEGELQELRAAKHQRQQQQQQQKLREHRGAASTIEERLALLLHTPGTAVAAGAAEQQNKEERLLLILQGLGEGEQANFLPPSLRISYAAAGPTEHVGIVGRTGSGKTTLLQTLSGVLRCRQGSVRLDGMDISLFPPEVLREIVGVLPQRPIVFSGMTVRDVLDPRGRYDDEALWKALDSVGISRLIRSLGPTDQLHTPVRATNATEEQLPPGMPRGISSESFGRSSSGSSRGSRSSSGSSAFLTRWMDEEAPSWSGEETRHAKGLSEERQKFRIDSLQSMAPQKAFQQRLTNCQLRYLALARLILQAPTCRLLLVDEPPAEAVEEVYDESRRGPQIYQSPRTEDLYSPRPHTPSLSFAKGTAVAGRPSILLSPSSVSQFATTLDTQSQARSRKAGVAATTQRRSGIGIKRHHQRFVFTPVPELLKRLFAHCTVFIVAHHVDSLQACDKVWLMWRGRIIGQCKPGDIRTDKQLADAMKKAVSLWKATTRKGAAAMPN